MSIKPLFADPNLLHLERVSSEPGLITIIVKTKSKQAHCPQCHSPSAYLHSRYVRQLVDLPSFGVAVHVEVHARRLYCRHMECPQRIFCERIPTFVVPYARRTLRLNEALRLTGLAVGGETGSRLAIALGMSVSPDTIIQRIRQIQLPTPPSPKVIGVDDWAKHKGQSYGTILVTLSDALRLISFRTGRRRRWRLGSNKIPEWSSLAAIAPAPMPRARGKALLQQFRLPTVGT